MKGKNKGTSEVLIPKGYEIDEILEDRKSVV